jgi:cation diffusion facilitator CzcD-associated flavoprotein CzcO/acetyl esterase/lipase
MQRSSAFDVVVVGAGFAGMYLLHRLRQLGFSARVIEAGSDVGGTWYWNRYPGARVDIQSVEYSYSFDPELEKAWQWSEKYAPQPEILRYAQFVADRYDLRRDIEFGTRVERAVWDDADRRWLVRTSKGEEIRCRHYVMASGCLSVPKDVDIPGADRFRGAAYHTSRWPHDKVDFRGKRVAVIGTGSSGIQAIPLIAQEASQLVVLQRTPNFAIPANNGPIPPDVLERYARDRDGFRHAERWSAAGVASERSLVSALRVSGEDRLATYESAWARAGIIEFLGSYADHLTSEEANELLAEFVRGKIRGIVRDPATAEALCPRDYPIGTKRLCVETSYYATYNLPHVRLIDLRKSPIATITERGIELAGESLELDAIVFATGFDAMTGAMVGVDIQGCDGRTLRDAWAHGPTTYLGLMVDSFPNLFMVTGPGSPSVLSNMMVSIEQHVDWITDCIARLRKDGLETIEPTELAVAKWVERVNDVADITLMSKANSWYMGANVPGKPRVFLPYAGGVDTYRRACDEVAARDYAGFVRRGPSGTKAGDGVLRWLQPDVMIALEMMAAMGMPRLESMTPVEARGLMDAMAGMRAPGPEVGEIVDGVLAGAAGDLRFRLYRPKSKGPHPILVYFHGGGWVLGSHDSDDPFCRDLCGRSNAIVVSVDYRHAPEARFPAAVDDAIAAVRWMARNAVELGGISGQLAVGGWSAGGNLAAVVCQWARDAGGPPIAGQLLLNPVTDGSRPWPSRVDNGDGYVLTTALMDWFWNHYADPGDRLDPKASPLRAQSLATLPPAIVVTCEFDPLRDEGIAYADALKAAGVSVQHDHWRGHTHTSLTAVDLLPSGVPARARMGEGIRGFFAHRAPPR